jgi:hypothetical protein
MSWLRVHDGEVLDPRVGELTDGEYRARQALMQFCAREHPEDGLFAAEEIIHAIYTTPRGARSVTRRHLARFQQLGMVRRRAEYSAGEIVALDLQDDWEEVDTRLRVHRWERYNPPRETSGEIQRRVDVYLEHNPQASGNEVCRAVKGQRRAVLSAVRQYRDGSQTGTGTTHGTGTGTGSPAGTRVPAPAFPSRPVPEELPRAVHVPSYAADPDPPPDDEPDTPTAQDEEYLQKITPELRSLT